MKKSLMIIIGIIALTQCFSQNETKTVSIPIHAAVVKEIIAAPMYTYIRTQEDTATVWISVPRTDLKVGDSCYHIGGVDMWNFHSKEINKTFMSILFMDNVSKTPQDVLKRGHMANQHGATPQRVKQEIEMDVVPGGISLAEIFAHKDQYDGKVIKTRGRVIKFTDGIMGKNWIHLQDGTNFQGDFDLTVTTLDDANVGDIIAVEGKISLNKDFGSGYFFKVILENAKRIE